MSANATRRRLSGPYIDRALETELLGQPNEIIRVSIHLIAINKSGGDGHCFGESLEASSQSAYKAALQAEFFRRIAPVHSAVHLPRLKDRSGGFYRPA
jgi:hypothetical protein